MDVLNDKFFGVRAMVHLFDMLTKWKDIPTSDMNELSEINLNPELIQFNEFISYNKLNQYL